MFVHHALFEIMPVECACLPSVQATDITTSFTFSQINWHLNDSIEQKLERLLLDNISA